METDRIYCMDCIEGMREIKDECVDLVIIDPPFSSGARTDAGRSVRGPMLRGAKWDNSWFSYDNLATHGFVFLMRHVFLEFNRVMKPGAHIYTFIDWRQLPNLMGVVESTGFILKSVIVWDKMSFGMGDIFRNQYELIIFASKGKPKPGNRKDLGNVIQSRRVPPENHPTEKPVALIEQLLSMSSQPGDLVLDCFAGGGSTAVACAKTDRRFIGFDLSKEYVLTATDRVNAIKDQMSLSDFKEGTPLRGGGLGSKP